MRLSPRRRTCERRATSSRQTRARVASISSHPVGRHSHCVRGGTRGGGGSPHSRHGRLALPPATPASAPSAPFSMGHRGGGTFAAGRDTWPPCAAERQGIVQLTVGAVGSRYGGRRFGAGTHSPWTGIRPRSCARPHAVATHSGSRPGPFRPSSRQCQPAACVLPPTRGPSSCSCWRLSTSACSQCGATTTAAAADGSGWCSGWCVLCPRAAGWSSMGARGWRGVRRAAAAVTRRSPAAARLEWRSGASDWGDGGEGAAGPRGTRRKVT